jgi:hypothetical protein
VVEHGGDCIAGRADTLIYERLAVSVADETPYAIADMLSFDHVHHPATAAPS